MFAFPWWDGHDFGTNRVWLVEDRRYPLVMLGHRNGPMVIHRYRVVTTNA